MRNTLGYARMYGDNSSITDIVLLLTWITHIGEQFPKLDNYLPAYGRVKIEKKRELLK
nr:MAG TPA: hypothetical protein [Caudoviricetes sp.]